MKKVTLIAINAQGASVQFTGCSKSEALRLFLREYDRKGFKIKYHDEYGREL